MRTDSSVLAPPARSATQQADTPAETTSARVSVVPSWCDWVIVLAAVAVFVAIAGRQWRLPGLYNDEAYDVVPAMQLVLGQPVELNRGVGLRVFGRNLPVMISDYQGVSSMYGVLPFFAVLGPSVLAIRAFTIGVAASALALTYLLGRRLFDRPTALLATLLLAVSPSFIFWARVGVYVVIQVVPLALGAMLAFLRWRRDGRAAWLALAGFSIGLGLSTKLLFLWFITGVTAGGVAVWLVNWRWPLDRQGRVLPHRPLRAHLGQPVQAPWRDVIAGTAGFLLGAAPLLYYNLISGGSYKVIRANLLQTEKGANNLAVLDNLARQVDSFRVLLEGSYFWFLGGVYANRLMPPLLLISTAGLLALVSAVGEYRRFRAPVVFILTLLAAIFVQSAFTLSGLETTHLLIALPLPQLLIAAFAVLLGQQLARLLARVSAASAPRAAALVLPAVLLLGPAAALDLQVNARYHQALAETGGENSFSASIYDLAAFLDKHGYTRPYALDWGMKYNLQFLTQGRVDPQEIYGQTRQPPPSFYAALDRLLDDESVVYLAHRDEGLGNPSAYRGRVAELTRLAEARGKQVVPVKVIYESGGRPLFYVYAVYNR